LRNKKYKKTKKIILPVEDISRKKIFKIKNEWIKGKVEKITGKEADIAIKLRKKKYGMSARLIGLFTSQKGNLIVYSINIMG